MDAAVIIVGAGPVGLSLAVNLGRAGIKTILLEQNPEPQFLPKMERCNARSMELFRRIGLSKKIRDAGLRADCSMDVFIVEDLTKPPLLEEKHPSIEESQKKIRDCNDLAMALEPYQLISQYTPEPLLKTKPNHSNPWSSVCAQVYRVRTNDTSVTVRCMGSNGELLSFFLQTIWSVATEAQARYANNLG